MVRGRWERCGRACGSGWATGYAHFGWAGMLWGAICVISIRPSAQEHAFSAPRRDVAMERALRVMARGLSERARELSHQDAAASTTGSITLTTGTEVTS